MSVACGNCQDTGCRECDDHALRQQLAAAQAEAEGLRGERDELQSLASTLARQSQQILAIADQRKAELQAERGRTWEAWAECERRDLFDIRATLLGDLLKRARAERDAARADAVREHEGRKAAVQQMQEHASEMQQRLNRMSDAWERDRAALERLAGAARRVVSSVDSPAAWADLRQVLAALPASPAPSPLDTWIPSEPWDPTKAVDFGTFKWPAPVEPVAVAPVACGICKGAGLVYAYGVDWMTGDACPRCGGSGKGVG